MSCLVATKNNTNYLLLDSLCHNSLQMGARMGTGRSTENNDDSRMIQTFQHNDLVDLERKLNAIRSLSSSSLSPPALHDANINNNNNNTTTTNIIVVVESIYSMDGDAAPLQQIMDCCLRHDACVVVDEAHGLGVFGGGNGGYSNNNSGGGYNNNNKGLGLGLLQAMNLQHHPALLCSIFTFGKAAGCHGAVVCSGSSAKTWIQFLYNYGRPIVYSTSLPLHALVTIQCAYETMSSGKGTRLRRHVLQLVQHFRGLIQKQVLDYSNSNSNIALR
ncbi:MAG: hypothetical protein SGARI_002205 [Bacillariaceae sp.]